jgi:hypothetical protein
MEYWGMESGGRNDFYVLCHMLPMNTRGGQKNDNKLGLTSES